MPIRAHEPIGDRELPRVVEFKERRVIRKERQVIERSRERVNDPTREQHRVARLNHNGAKFPRFFHIRQVVKQSDPRGNHEQPIRELVHVQRQVFGPSRESKMHEAIFATVTRPPRATFDAGVPFEPSINVDRMRLAKARMQGLRRSPRRCFLQMAESHDRPPGHSLDRAPDGRSHQPKPRTKNLLLIPAIVLTHIVGKAQPIRERQAQPIHFPPSFRLSPNQRVRSRRPPNASPRAPEASNMLGTCLVRRISRKSRYGMEKSQPPEDPRQCDAVSLETRIHILLEEYRTLYSLLTFRLSAMDRRLPIAGGALWAVLSAATSLPPDSMLALLLGLPAAMLWLLSTTVQLARSKEDHLRRIDEIERMVNVLVGEELLVFQSRHPNKAAYPAGRTGFGMVLAVLTACLAMLAATAYLAIGSAHSFPVPWRPAYGAYVAVSTGTMLWQVLRLRRYRYRRPATEHPPVFEQHFS